MELAQEMFDYLQKNVDKRVLMKFNESHALKEILISLSVFVERKIGSAVVIHCEENQTSNKEKFIRTATNEEMSAFLDDLSQLG